MRPFQHLRLATTILAAALVAPAAHGAASSALTSLMPAYDAARSALSSQVCQCPSPEPCQPGTTTVGTVRAGRRGTRASAV